ncbi:hypothetical protein TNCV_705101 [Trichonephila clavipes]|nr:hypothetical protein TNCV_705101 [Trichonephila clavipes]
MILETEWLLSRASTIGLRWNASKSGSLPIPAITTTNEDNHSTLYLQLPQCPNLRMNDAQCYTICTALAIPHSVILQCIYGDCELIVEI